jgi:hypothetical protein
LKIAKNKKNSLDDAGCAEQIFAARLQAGHEQRVSKKKLKLEEKLTTRGLL